MCIRPKFLVLKNGIKKAQPVNMIRRKSSIAYASGKEDLAEQPKMFDFRTDTLSIPTKEIWSVMFNTSVGHTEVHEDPQKNALEKKAASIFGKEDSVLVTTGIMANLVSILAHCKTRPSEILLGDRCHTNLFEQAGPAQFGGVNMQTVENKPDGTFDINELINKIRTNPMVEPTTSLICLENTHNICGGRIVPQEWVDEVVDIAKSRGIPIHMDGARIFNAAVKLKTPVSRLVRGCDSVIVSLSKSLGCPYGSMVLGSKKFISEVRRIVKAIGGGNRQTGFLAAAGIYAFDNMIDRMEDDHEHVQMIANAIREMDHPYITVPPADEIHTNILNIHLEKNHVTPQDLLLKLGTVSNDGPNVTIKAFTFSNSSVRFTICCDLSKSDIPYVIEKIQYVMKELR